MLRGPDVDRAPGLLLILAAEHTVDLRTPKPLVLDTRQPGHCRDFTGRV